MSLKSTPCFVAALAIGGLIAQTNDKPSPIRYKSPTSPAGSATRPHNKAAPNGTKTAEPDSSRNRLAALPNTALASKASIVGGVQTGIACFYGVPPQREVTSEVETSDRSKLMAAHPTLPFGSRVEVTNVLNGRSVVVTISDRIPADGDRIISVNRRAAEQLGFVNAGTTRVKLELVRQDSRM
jgi:rare lipoprotein A (peptidoglycan hydrolase)